MQPAGHLTAPISAGTLGHGSADLDGDQASHPALLSREAVHVLSVVAGIECHGLDRRRIQRAVQKLPRMNKVGTRSSRGNEIVRLYTERQSRRIRAIETLHSQIAARLVLARSLLAMLRAIAPVIVPNPQTP